MRLVLAIVLLAITSCYEVNIPPDSCYDQACDFEWQVCFSLANWCWDEDTIDQQRECFALDMNNCNLQFKHCKLSTIQPCWQRLGHVEL